MSHQTLNNVLNAESGIINDVIVTACVEGSGIRSELSQGTLTNEHITEKDNGPEDVTNIIENPVIHAISMENLQAVGGINAAVTDVGINEAAGDNKSKSSKFAFKRFFKRSRKQHSVEEVSTSGEGANVEQAKADDEKGIGKEVKAGCDGKIDETTTAPAIVAEEPQPSTSTSTSTANVSRVKKAKSSFSVYFKSIISKVSGRNKCTYVPVPRVPCNTSGDDGFTDVELNGLDADTTTSNNVVVEPKNVGKISKIGAIGASNVFVENKEENRIAAINDKDSEQDPKQ